MELPLVDVSSDTVSQTWPLLLLAVKQAHFISLDLVRDTHPEHNMASLCLSPGLILSFRNSVDLEIFQDQAKEECETLINAVRCVYRSGQDTHPASDQLRNATELSETQ